jgi:ubiquitin C-terminal hydrolase
MVDPQDAVQASFARAVVEGDARAFIDNFRAAAAAKGFPALAVRGCQDSHELYLLWTEMFPEWAKTFMIQLVELIRCTACHAVRRTESGHACLELANSGTVLSEALEAYFAPVSLPGGTCDACQAANQLQKRYVLRRPLPEHFVFHLVTPARFARAMRMRDGQVYTLMAVVYHPPGHYFARVCDGDRWYVCDDDQIQLCAPPSGELDPQACLLFYRQQWTATSS